MIPAGFKELVMQKALDTTVEVVPLLSDLSEVESEHVDWLWPERIPLGAVTLLVGDPGLGKSLVTLDLAARLSIGADWPDGEPGTRGGVLLLNGEDSESRTVVPRLKSASADLRRIRLVRGVREVGPTGCERTLSLRDDMQALEAAVRACPDCRLVVIDPVTAFLGSSDGNGNAYVRQVLRFLAGMAEAHRVAVIAVSHLNKREGGRAMYRAMGSLAFLAAARMAWGVCKDPRGERNLLLPLKTNLAAPKAGLAYELVGNADGGAVHWQREPVTESLYELLGSSTSGGTKPSPRDQSAYAIEWLREQLSAGAEEARDLQIHAGQAGISPWHLHQASIKIGVRKTKNQFVGNWEWSLAEGKKNGSGL
jgi:hypothetical protein